MVDKLRSRGIYFVLCSAFIGFALVLIILYPKGRSFFILNGLHSPATDVLFTYATEIGDGLTAVILLALVLIFYKFGAGLAGLLGLGLVGLMSYAMKYWIFYDSIRPHLYFWGNKMIHYTEGVKTNIANSFPSGHTFTAFYVFTFLVLLGFGKSTLVQICCALLAILAAYSRVYLAQHFVGDIVAGALMGIAVAFLFYRLHILLKQKAFFKKSLLHLILRKS